MSLSRRRRLPAGSPPVRRWYRRKNTRSSRAYTISVHFQVAIQQNVGQQRAPQPGEEENFTDSDPHGSTEGASHVVSSVASRRRISARRRRQSNGTNLLRRNPVSDNGFCRFVLCFQGTWRLLLVAGEITSLRDTFRQIQCSQEGRLGHFTGKSLSNSLLKPGNQEPEDFCIQGARIEVLICYVVSVGRSSRQAKGSAAIVARGTEEADASANLVSSEP